MKKENIENYDENAILSGITYNHGHVEKNAVIFQENNFEKEREALYSHIQTLNKHIETLKQENQQKQITIDNLQMILNNTLSKK